MLQVGLGGYQNVSANSTILDDNPVYYEPGFNLLSPLEQSVPPADQIYMLLRKRSDVFGGTYDTISPNQFHLTVKDITTGEDIPARIEKNATTSTVFNSNWSSGGFVPLVVVIDNSIDINILVTRVRVLDCFIKYALDDSFIVFRLIVDDVNKLFHFIIVNIDNIKNKNTFTAAGHQALVDVGTNSDNYVLFSPFAYLKEVPEEKSDFSYPISSVFYQRQKTYNDEDFYFSISGYSHNFVIDNVSVINVPNYQKAGVVMIDKQINTDMRNLTGEVYVEITVRGVLSEMEDTFTIYFIR